MKITAKRPLRDEKGQTMILVLILLLTGIIIITPVLNFMGTGMTSGRVYEQKIDEIYAADAGVEDALWHIRYDYISELLGEDYDEYDYSTTYPYLYDLNVNGKDVAVTVQNIWIPKDIAVPSPSEARQIIEDEKLLIIGYPSSTESTYSIKIVYYWETTQERDALKVETIGLWLSPGFEYVAGTSSLADHDDTETISLYKGGSAVVWDFDSVTLESFPEGEDGPPMVKTLTFEYTAPEGELPELVSSWIVTSGVAGVTYAWDDSIRLYKIVSEAGGIQVKAYGAKTKFRRLKSTISSDYAVAGNTLMESTGSPYTCTSWPNFPDSYYRERLYKESDSTILRAGIEEIPDSGVVPPGKIPEEAMIEDVYLYWTGWIDYYYYRWEEELEWVCEWVWYPYPWPYGHSEYECHWVGGWIWDTIPELRYPNSPTQANLTTLVEESAKVNQVELDVDGDTHTITADRWQVVETTDCFDAPDSWAYSCFKKITNLELSGGMTVREYIEEAMTSNSTSGEVEFTLGHAVVEPRPGYNNYYFYLYDSGEYTGYPLATPAHKKPDESCYTGRYNYTYSGWSLIIFYRTPALKQRQLNLFDDFIMNTTIGPGPPYDEDFTVSNFLAPPVLSEDDTSHLTYFVGEGDPHFEDSSIGINIGTAQGVWLEDDPPNPVDNVFNSKSSAIPVTDSDGIDFDTFELPQGCILPYDASAEVKLRTEHEIYFLVYIVLSFRSDLTTGGIITNYSVTPTG
jgi:hypothetical protein